MSEQSVYTLPVLPLKNAVLFPYLLMPLSAGRPGSIAAVEAALASESKEIALFAQRDPDVDIPAQNDLYLIRRKAVIHQVNRRHAGPLRFLRRALARRPLVA